MRDGKGEERGEEVKGKGNRMKAKEKQKRERK